MVSQIRKWKTNYWKSGAAGLPIFFFQFPKGNGGSNHTTRGRSMRPDGAKIHLEKVKMSSQKAENWNPISNHASGVRYCSRLWMVSVCLFYSFVSLVQDSLFTDFLLLIYYIVISIKRCKNEIEGKSWECLITKNMQ